MQGKDFKERDCMSFDGFCICVRMDIQERLGTGFLVREETITKNNGTKRKAVVIREQGKSISQTIYMEGFYEAYKDGRPLQEVEDNVLQAYHGGREAKKFDVDFFRDWQEVKGRVIYKLINSDRNRELLEDVPHRRILDLAIVYECFLGADNAGSAAILIRNSHMELWGVTEDELYGTAFRNTPELMGCSFASMTEILVKTLMEDMGFGKAGLDSIKGLPPVEENACPMYVLTNQYKLHGAGCILYKNLLKGIAEKWGCDICILPSSIHEVILIPMCSVGSHREMSQMVREVNETQLMPEDVLSDHTYQFVRKTGEIIMQEERGHE